jgi:hypothetical protein
MVQPRSIGALDTADVVAGVDEPHRIDRRVAQQRRGRRRSAARLRIARDAAWTGEAGPTTAGATPIMAATDTRVPTIRLIEPET